MRLTFRLYCTATLKGDPGPARRDRIRALQEATGYRQSGSGHTTYEIEDKIGYARDQGENIEARFPPGPGRCYLSPAG